MKTKKRLIVSLWSSLAVGWAAVLSMLYGIFPEKTYYFYYSKKIIELSWHNAARVIVWIAIATAIISLVWLTVLKIIDAREQGKKHKWLAAIKYICLWALVFILMFLMTVFLFLRFTLRYDGDECFEFTDGNHKIVIQESSFLLSGHLSVFQINKDHTAEGIGGAGTDDGYRNYGNYEIEWFDEYVKITFCNGIRSDSFETIECEFE